ncbi:MAG: GGDEF domain-containing protein [Elusimicrobia bacterium]|nr:GGDEF domain-containing protein [Elusimicrobiota bacterium]
MRIDFDLAHALLFWGTVPVLWGCILFSDARCFFFGGIFGVLAVLHSATGLGGAVDLALHLGTYGLAVMVPLYFRRSQSALERDFTRRRSALQEQKTKVLHKHESVLREKADRQENLEALQNRFALVQVMATKLEAGEILQTLGHMWKKRAGVKGALILRRQLNGNWGTAFTDGHFNAQDWVRVLASHPSLGRSRNIRRYAASGKQLTLPGQPFGSTCLLVPFTWDKDILAMGILEVDPNGLEESSEGFNIERKLVSIGLRRADLYDLMTERSRFDALTGAFLRRSMTERLEDGLRKSHRYTTPLFFALMDIDSFKTLNDRWGHLVGDKVLIHLAQAVRRLAHPGITLGRFGGDEFALILEMETVTEVFAWFERLRQGVAETPLRDREAIIRYTVSAGISAYLPERPPLSELMAQADHALYQAKRAGRDRVMLWRAPGTTAPASRK